MHFKLFGPRVVGNKCRLNLNCNFNVRGMAGKFVDTSAIRKSNALLKKRFAQFQAAISYEYISEILCNLK